ncbi:MAG TPA: ribosome-associated translation inhibitor RaiA [Fimbriimonadaceae bacterium]|nr:ribosome-associated translation inhibitor RaiA [Fimbriimonadaceae bacterium]
MEVLVRNAEGNVTKTDRDYAASKLGRLDRYFHQAQKVEMVHREEKGMHRIEITVFADGFTIRGEETEATLQAAIDKVKDKIETRLRKLKGRLVQSHRKKGVPLPPALADEPTMEDGLNGSLVKIKERKPLDLRPMTIDEAALQMEMIDHPFFVFRNGDSGQVEVLYKRRDGAYGLLQTA